MWSKSMGRCIMDGWVRERTWRTKRTWWSLREGMQPHNTILSRSILTNLWWRRYTQLADFFCKHLWTYYKSCGWRNLRVLLKWHWSTLSHFPWHEYCDMRYIHCALKRPEVSRGPIIHRESTSFTKFWSFTTRSLCWRRPTLQNDLSFLH